MKKLRLIVLVVALLILPLVISNRVWAAPKFPSFAQVQQMISDALNPIQNSIANLTGRVSTNEINIATQSAQIAGLQQQAVPDVDEVVFFPAGDYTFGQESPIIDTDNHKVLFLTVRWISGSGGWRIFYSNDQTNWTFQGDITGASPQPPIQKALPIKGRYLKLTIVGNFPGEAVGFLN